jgi:hypothetical protein
MSLTVEEKCRPVHSIRHGPRPTVLWFPDIVEPTGTEANKAPVGSWGIVTVPGSVGLWQKTPTGWLQLEVQVLI